MQHFLCFYTTHYKQLINKEALVRYSFEVRDYDYYNVMIDINYNGNATVNVISNNRSSISYQGYLTNYTDS